MSDGDHKFGPTAEYPTKDSCSVSVHVDDCESVSFGVDAVPMSHDTSDVTGGVKSGI